MGCGHNNKMFLIMLALFFMLVMLTNTSDSSIISINESMTNVKSNSKVEIDSSKIPKLIKNSEEVRLNDQYVDKYCPTQPFIGKNRGYLNWEQTY